MFVRYFVEIDRPARDVERDLLASPERWSSEPLDGARVRRERLLADVGLGSSNGHVNGHIEAEFGEAVRFPTKTVLPMTWTTNGPEPVFPPLKADVEVAALGAGRTQLSISATYTPPRPPAGQEPDRMVLHRVAEATIKDFLDRAAAILASSAELEPAEPADA